MKSALQWINRYFVRFVTLWVMAILTLIVCVILFGRDIVGQWVEYGIQYSDNERIERLEAESAGFKEWIRHHQEKHRHE